MKISKDEQLRREGIRYAYDFIKKNGYEKFVKDCEWRGIVSLNSKNKNIHPDVPLRISRGQFDDFMIANKQITVATMGIMTCLTLHDEFGFGHKRLQRYLDRFNGKTEVLESPELTETTWKDYHDILVDECDIHISIPGYNPETNKIER